MKVKVMDYTWFMKIKCMDYGSLRVKTNTAWERPKTPVNSIHFPCILLHEIHEIDNMVLKMKAMHFMDHAVLVIVMMVST